MSPFEVLGLVGLLTFKHFLVDFTQLQTPYMYENKGDPRHLGGYLHAGFHAFVSLMIFIWYTTDAVLLTSITLFELLVHYCMDCFKVNICKDLGWAPNTSPHYWLMLGIDQLVHYATYLFMVYLLLESGYVNWKDLRSGALGRDWTVWI